MAPKEELEKLYTHDVLTDTEIGEKLGVSEATVGRWRKAHGITSRRRGPSRKDWTDQDLTKAVQGNKSIAGVLRDLGLSVTGGNYATIHKAVERFGLDTSHWTGQAHLRGKTHSHVKPRPLSEVMVKNSTYPRCPLKARLFKEGILKNECSECGQGPEWKDKTLVMVLDHINGVNNDHRRENLRMLCPNCNSQTPTFCGRNVPRKPPNTCPCGVKIHRGSARCTPCAAKVRAIRRFGALRKPRIKGKPRQRKAVRPDRVTLEAQIEEHGYCGTGRLYGVSDNAIRKWLKSMVGNVGVEPTNTRV